MTFDEWMLTVAPGHKPSDDSVSLRILRKCWQAAEAAERERIQRDVQDLALMIGRLVTALRKARPMAPQDLDYKALDLLTRKGLRPSPLRDAPNAELTGPPCGSG